MKARKAFGGIRDSNRGWIPVKKDTGAKERAVNAIIGQACVYSLLSAGKLL